MTLSILTSVVVMLSVLCFTGGLLLSRRDKSLTDRLDVYLSTGDPNQVVTLKELELSRPFSERVILPIAQRAARLFARSPLAAVQPHDGAGTDLDALEA